ncbi:hypothetical protein E2C01_012443 [Portunus trituberculatus]|uniref:Uncharacterized protein n=1 Tax=Portunus trituberculatus TaxID=210409 RepID=A0A5B7DE02_PORTR|nr:hypothetical protein [Portunus trituberculatus]
MPQGLPNDAEHGRIKGLICILKARLSRPRGPEPYTCWRRVDLLALSTNDSFQPRSQQLARPTPPVARLRYNLKSDWRHSAMDSGRRTEHCVKPGWGKPDPSASYK